MTMVTLLSMDQNQYLKEKVEEYKSLLDKKNSSTPLPTNYLQLVENDDGALAGKKNSLQGNDWIANVCNGRNKA